MTDTIATAQPEITIEKINLDDHQTYLDQMTKPERYQRMIRIGAGELIEVALWPNGDTGIAYETEDDELPPAHASCLPAQS